MALTLMGKKKGMTQLFDDNGNLIPLTIIQCESNVVTQIKTQETDGYCGVQLGFDQIQTKDSRTKERRVGKPLMGHFSKGSLEPRRFLSESRLDDVSEFSVGQEIGVDIFTAVSHVDVSGTSKGKGYQGVIKVHGFSGGRASHGSGFHRTGGSTGMRSTPGRVLSGQKKPKRLGGKAVTTQNARVYKVDVEKGLMMIIGAVPGPIDGLVYIKPAVKKNGGKRN